MKIESTDRTRATSKVSKTSRSSGASGSEFASHLESAMGSEATSSAAPTNNVAAVDALLALQELGTATEETRRAKLHGMAILDQLDAMRLGLLEGRLSMSQIERLASLSKQQMQFTVDPVLLEILEDIHLRAEVELAKLQTAMKRQKQV